MMVLVSEAVPEILDGALDNLLVKRKETEYVKITTEKEAKAVKKYNLLKKDKARAKYLIKLVHRGDLSAACRIYFKYCLDKGCLCESNQNKSVYEQRFLNWADKLVDKLFEDGVPGLVPIYTTEIYHMGGGLEREEIKERVAKKFEAKGVTKYKDKDLVGSITQTYRSFMFTHLGLC